MMLNEGERLVVAASLAWAAMEHEKIALQFAKNGKTADAARAAYFSGECARLAEQFDPALNARR